MTDWHGLIERVKNKQASPEEKTILNEKMAEFQALQDYLFEEELVNLPKDTPIDLPKVSYQKIKRETNRRIVKKVLLILLIVFGIVGVGQYFGKKLLDRIYFDPTVTMDESDVSNLGIYEMLYTELTRPEVEWRSTQVTPLSGGKYQIEHFYQKKYAEDWTPSLQSSYQLKRGKVVYPDNYENQLVAMEHYPMFLNAEREGLESMIDNQRETTLEKVQELPKSGGVYGFLTFKQALTTQEMLDFFGPTNEMNVRSLSVENQAAGDTKDNGNLQFGMDLMHGMSAQHSNKALMKINKEYPELFPFAFLYSRPSFDVTTYEQHYLSLLRYLIDNQEMLSYLPDTSTTIEEIEQALTYVEKNGVKINGVYLSGSVDEFLAYAQKEEVLVMEVFEASLYRQGG